MKTTNFGQFIKIDAKKSYTLEELYAVLKEKGQFESGSPELKKIVGIPCIVFPGAGGYCNQVTVRKNKITIGQTPDSAKGVGKYVGLSALTDGWSSVLNMGNSKNAAVMETIGREIERLVT
jgi:hypothetical protein